MTNEQWVLDRLVEAAKIMAVHDERIDGLEKRIDAADKRSDDDDREAKSDELARARERREDLLESKRQVPAWWMILLVSIGTLVAVADLVSRILTQK